MEQGIEQAGEFFKFAIVGDPKVGKSQIWNRFLGKKFSSRHEATLMVEHEEKKVQQENMISTIQLWDTSNESFSLEEGLLRHSTAMAIILDGTDSVENQKKSMSEWVAKIKALEPNALIYFIVNKIDVSSSFIGENAWEIAVREWNLAKKQEEESHQDIPVMFCSAKKNAGINEAFTWIVNDCRAKIFSQSEKKSSSIPIPSQLPMPSHRKTFWEDLKEEVLNNKFRSGGSAFFLVVLMVLLMVAAFPFGSFLAMGPLSAVAVAVLIGGGGFLLWNVGCSVVNALRNFRQPPTFSPDGGEDNPSSGIISVDEFIGNGNDEPNAEAASYKSGEVYQKPSDQTSGVVQPPEQQGASKQQKL